MVEWREHVLQPLVIAAPSPRRTGCPRRRWLPLLISGVVTVGAACFDFRFGGGGGGEEPPSDCISPQKPSGGTLCGLNAWDRDGDTISETTENNTANAIANAGSTTSASSGGIPTTARPGVWPPQGHSTRG